MTFYRVTADDIREQARAKGYSGVQAEIVAQLWSLNPLFRAVYDVKALVNITHEGEDGHTREGVRLHVRAINLTMNLDVIYYPVPDVYRVIGYKLTNHGLDVATVYDSKDVYFPELLTAVEEAIRKATTPD